MSLQQATVLLHWYHLTFLV